MFSVVGLVFFVLSRSLVRIGDPLRMCVSHRLSLFLFVLYLLARFKLTISLMSKLSFITMVRCRMLVRRPFRTSW